MKTRHLVAGLLSGISMLSISSAAFAQASTNQAAEGQQAGSQVSALEPSPAAQSTDPMAQSASPGGTDIVVTGSRVIQNGNNSPTPVTVVIDGSSCYDHADDRRRRALQAAGVRRPARPDP